mmetsp:Transcript_4893/g.9331  ORF Transcript_4893/g.9331 Transcript_4893/m.9331 type:complete len:2158 (+) Transcript_4893:121-6594(+)|eukprot:CAMPEP_0176503802 /NCGR_PEP_ID=MMETSP0200_2-20121128/15579_1 /TAXON_ID=947934 /ORGANISM="Chaetoceros sp., Strain GSL56" /LENGTH=2157 /DNA_ID=CAMNT_0017903161 /DNA_START=46 /DNA_END=6519 /DNA_ORIENTATION=+
MEKQEEEFYDTVQGHPEDAPSITGETEALTTVEEKVPSKEAQDDLRDVNSTVIVEQAVEVSKETSHTPCSESGEITDESDYVDATRSQEENDAMESKNDNSPEDPASGSYEPPSVDASELENADGTVISSSGTASPNQVSHSSSPTEEPEENFNQISENVQSNNGVSITGPALPCYVVPSTPIPNSDSALRLLRKFAAKTSKYFPVMFGGSKSSSIFGFLFGGNSCRDECALGYKILVDILLSDIDDTEDEESHTPTASNGDENDAVIDSILGHTGDTMSKARSAIAAFCYLFELFCLETQRMSILQMGGDTSIFQELLKKRIFQVSDNVESGNLQSQSSFVTGEVMAAALTCAEGLVAHGCFDGVLLATREADHLNISSDSLALEASKDSEYYNAIYVICESLYNCFLESEETELAALKFLLTAGTRSMNVSSASKECENEAMLKGTHLLQAIRVCYRLYLSTDSAANKTTAKAALRQIVIGTFRRLELKTDSKTANPESQQNTSINATLTSDGDDPFCHEMDERKEKQRGIAYSDDMTLKSPSSSGGNFPSFEHKDAYLVLRSLCKLSMKALSNDPDVSLYLSYPAAASRHENSSLATEPASKQTSSRKFLRQSVMIDPALDSKILALDLILEILQKTKPEIFVNAGPHLVNAVRNYLCHSLLKNCIMDNTYVVSLSLQLFSPLVRHFRSHLKTEIEAFVTNVFFVILNSKNSAVEHKLRVVMLFEEICSDPATLAEIFLNYDCDLSAVDLFQRIVNTLAKVAKIGLQDQGIESTGLFVGGAGATRAEKNRQDHRALRLEAMKAVRKILASLYASVSNTTVSKEESCHDDDDIKMNDQNMVAVTTDVNDLRGSELNDGKSLVQIYDSKKKMKEDFAKVVLKFNQKPKAGIKLADELGLLNDDDPASVAEFLLVNKDSLDKTQIGELLGMDVEYKDGFMLKVLQHYANSMDFAGLLFDDAIKIYLSGFRLPGEAQKIDRIMEIFAERYTTQNPEVFPTADSAFILAFSVIMLNTDLHNPAIKEERRMTKSGFLRNNRGICDGQDLPEELLSDIFDRIKSNPISLKEDDEARQKVGNLRQNGGRQPATGLFATNFDEMDKTRITNYKKERDEILRNTESLLRRRATRTNSGSYKGSKNFVRTEDSGLKDEYVSPMFEVAWGPALAVFSTVIESANGTMGSLLSIATDHEIENAAENAAESTEVCLEGFKLAIRLAGVCGNPTARSAYVHALSNFSLLGTGRLLEHRHIRCVQTLLELGRDDGEILGPSWEYVFKALSEVARLNQVYEEGAKFIRTGKILGSRKNGIDSGTKSQLPTGQLLEDGGTSADRGESSSFDEIDEVLINGIYDGHFGFDEELDKIVIDEINARTAHDNLAEDLLDYIFSRSSSLSAPAIKEFIFQLCRVSRMEISGYGGSIGNKANDVDLTAVHYRRHHSLVGNNGRVDGKRNQPDIFCLQKLIEVTHYNMDTRPRLVFADIWNTVSSHLTSTALHNNAAVAMYAVDSFRQLSMQFLKRQELGVFEFQRKFIKPFENVMIKCKNASIKEFLLKSVEQIITIYGDDSSTDSDSLDFNQGLLRSGWRPLLSVIGQASCDDDDAIAKLGFSMLTSQIRLSLHINDENTMCSNGTINPAFGAAVPMRADKFVDLVEALLMYVSGPRDDMSSDSIDELVVMCRYLAAEKIPLPQNSRVTHIHPSRPDALNTSSKNSFCLKSNEELELWWPIMLGLSKTIGDKRPNIRIKGLITLLAVINEHFFVDQADNSSTSSVLGDLQTLQLIFRGVLTPSLEHTDLIPDSAADTLTLPDGFIRFITKAPSESNISLNGRLGRSDVSNTIQGNDWLETTFDHLMDGAVAIVLRSIAVYKNDTLVEEILAMFNTCLVSDSISLVIRGLKRLYHFIANDLSLEKITNNTWATFCHMLRKCLAVNGLPFITDTESSLEISSDVLVDFLQEEKLLPQRHYIGGNVVSIIGSLLADAEIAKSMGSQWYLFLVSGLGMGIQTWDKASKIMDSNPAEIVWSNPNSQPPSYSENSLYARKLMVRLLLKHISGEDNLLGTMSDNLSKALLKSEIDSIVNGYLEKEARASSGTPNPGEILELEHMTKLVCNLLEGISKLDSTRLSSISSLTPTLTACIQTDDRSIRTIVHKLLQRIFQLNEEANS